MRIPLDFRVLAAHSQMERVGQMTVHRNIWLRCWQVDKRESHLQASIHELMEQHDGLGAVMVSRPGGAEPDIRQVLGKRTGSLRCVLLPASFTYLYASHRQRAHTSELVFVRMRQERGSASLRSVL